MKIPLIIHYTLGLDRQSPDGKWIGLAISFEELRQPVSQFTRSAAEEPEPINWSSHHSQPGFHLRLQCPFQSHAQVIQFFVQSVQPECLIRTIQFGPGLRRQFHKISEVTLTKDLNASHFQ